MFKWIIKKLRVSSLLLLCVLSLAALRYVKSLQMEVALLKAEKRQQQNELMQTKSETSAIRKQYDSINIALTLIEQKRRESELTTSKLKKALNHAQLNIPAASEPVPADVINRLRQRAETINNTASSSG